MIAISGVSLAIDAEVAEIAGAGEVALVVEVEDLRDAVVAEVDLKELGARSNDAAINAGVARVEDP